MACFIFRFKTVYNMFNGGYILFGSVISLLVLGLHEYYVRFGNNCSEPPFLIMVYYISLFLLVVNNFVTSHALRYISNIF